MALKSVESHTIEFKSNWRDEYLKVISALIKTQRKNELANITLSGELCRE